MTFPGLDMGLELGPSGGDDFSPDNWLVDQVQAWTTPPMPAGGGRVRNEPHTVAAPLGAAAAGGTMASAIDAAMTKLDTMYDWGGTGVNGRGVDCSGLIYYAYRAAGFNVDRYRAVDYGHMGVQVDEQDAMPGDIVYFDNPNSDTDHVGLYLGNGKFIEAPQPGSRVQVSNLRSGAVIRRIAPEGAYRGLPRNGTGNVTYQHNNTEYTAGRGPGPQRDPLDILASIDKGESLGGLEDMSAELQDAIADKTPITPEGNGGDAFSKFLGAVSGQESGGDYSVQNSVGAIGKYQVMYYNVGAWTKGALGHSMSPQEFRNSPAAQEAVARWRLGSLVAQYGYRGAAAAWYSGNPNRASDYSPLKNGSGPSVGDYVDQVLARMGL